ncbi:MAG TPA: CoA transferase, partial [Candidatus Ozemobacteraceae bacterium]|nr:CoA transferase [Candidatus Ozemobacteraceae bacterium]
MNTKKQTEKTASSHTSSVHGSGAKPGAKAENASSADVKGPLDGIVVIDLTRVLAGPYCSMMLADMGATVIKVERPEGGDDARAYTPFINGESAYFMSINRGKKSVTLNLKSERGREILIDLVKKADVLLENFKPGVMTKLGLAYDELAKHNPRLIYAASSGFGQNGPYSARPAYDL